MAANISDEEVVHAPLTVFIDKEIKKVVYAEAGKDFVDILLSFLALPLGTIARLIAEESNMKPMKIGSISSLYESVADLDEKYLWSPTCKEMLLQPRSSMGGYLQKMKLNIDDAEPFKSFFLCENKACLVKNKLCVSFFQNQKCFCGKPLNREKSVDIRKENGFVKETSTYIVSDDLYVMPNVVGTILNLLQKHGVSDIDACYKQTVNISKKEVIDLLKLSLLSKTPLTDFIFEKEGYIAKLDTRSLMEFWSVDVDQPCYGSKEMVVTVHRRKSNMRILFVEAYDNFVNFLLSFLSFPLGGVLHILHGFSFSNCIDNLYKSINVLSSHSCLKSEILQLILTNPIISIQYEIGIQKLPICINYHDYFKAKRSKLYHFAKVKSPISRGYVKGPLKFMVTDDLVMSPMSSSNVVSYLERMNVPLNDLEEKDIMIGRKEALSILKASLTSTSALTNGLTLYMMEQFMDEQRSQSVQKE